MATGSVNARKHGITQHFGEDPATYKKFGYKGHPGIDTGQKYRQYVYAEENGTVKNTYTNDPTAGNYVVIKSPRSTTTYLEWRFLHLSSFLVKPGQKIKRGDPIGRAGSTGYSTAVHNHEDMTPRFRVWPYAPLYPLNGYKGKKDPKFYLDNKY